MLYRYAHANKSLENSETNQPAVCQRISGLVFLIRITRTQRTPTGR
jgi:hypothetical protein